MKSSISDSKKLIKQEQDKLKGLSDDELRQIHLDIYESAIKFNKEIDATFLIAVMNEVQRRWQAVSWIWARKSHSVEYEKWNEHHRQSEIKASDCLIFSLSQDNDPNLQELINRLKYYKETL